jgi:hypothetical protein
MRKIIKIGIFVGIVLIIAQIGAWPLSLPQATKLQTDVWKAPYSTLDYEEDEFDCSNMAALLGDWLELQKWNTTIVRTPGKHAWIEVCGKKYVEPTSKNIFFAGFTYNQKYILQERYNDSNEIYQYLSERYDPAFAKKSYGYQQYLIEHSGKEFKNLTGYG